MCGLFGCWGDMLIGSRATRAPQTTGMSNRQSYLRLQREQTYKAILRNLCYMNYRRKSYTVNHKRSTNESYMYTIIYIKGSRRTCEIVLCENKEEILLY